MKELLRMYKESNSVLEKANIWSHIAEKVEEIAVEKNPDEYGGSLYLDEDYYINLGQTRDAYKRGFIQAIQVLEFE